jgi:hypothetical protein
VAEPTFKLPRLPTNWNTQPQLFERYWDMTMNKIEDILNRILVLPIIQEGLAQAAAAAALAKQLANNAQTSADGAQTSANNAQTTANKAVSDAAAADQKATNAAQAASGAQGTADSAYSAATAINPLLVAERDNGGTVFQTITNAFTVIPISTVVKGSGYNTSTGLYTVPSAGNYLIVGHVRLPDGATAGVGLAVGVGTANSDDAALHWDATVTLSNTSAVRRNEFNVTRVLPNVTAGQQIRLYMYVDNGTTGLGITKASLSVFRLPQSG